MMDGIWNKYPATKWYEATPLGNGRIGALVFGNLHNETVVFNNEELYTVSPEKDIPNISECLYHVRKLMDEGKYLQANNYYSDTLYNQGYSNDTGRFIPALDLQIVQPVEGEFADYKRELDFEHGICQVKWGEDSKSYQRNYFVSQADNIAVIKINSLSGISKLKIGLKERDLLDCRDYRGQTVKSYINTKSEIVDGKYIYFKAKTDCGIKYGAILKVVCEETVECNDTNIPRGAGATGETLLNYDYLLCSGKNITLLLDIFILTDQKSFKNTRKRIDSINLIGIEERHCEKFSKLYNSCRFDIKTENNPSLSNEQILLNAYGSKVNLADIINLAKFGRYLFISSSMNCNLPSNLQGVWGGGYFPTWNCTFFNNENIEMNYWQAMQGNLCESMLILFNFYDKFKDDYRMNAKNLYGCKGILLPLFMDNHSGKKKNLSPHVLYWTGSSGWIASLYFDYYRYTGDEEFLLKRAYPFMKEAFEFYEDFTVIKDGKLQIYPSNSPENSPLGDFKGAGSLRVCKNATMDFAIIKELTTNLLYIQENYIHNDSEILKYKAFLKLIPDYEINEDGAIKEWMCDDFKDNYQHRHISHIYPLFPGTEITKETDIKLFNAIEIALDKRIQIGLKAQSGWSLAHLSNAFARLNQGKKALKCLEDIFKFCTMSNYLTVHNDWRKMGSTLEGMSCGIDPIFQIDCNLGVTSAILEMLVYSNSKIVKIFPAKPEEWNIGSFKNILTRNRFKISARWDDEKAIVEIYSKISSNIDIKVEGYFFDDGCNNKILHIDKNENKIITLYK